MEGMEKKAVGLHHSPEPLSLVEGETELLEDLLHLYSPTGSEGEVADYLIDRMETLGWRAFRDGAGNAVGQLGNGSKHLVFLGHIDTVPGYIPVRRQGGYLWGRGAVDAKGPLAAFIAAAARLNSLGDKRITIIGAVGEEGGNSAGARHVLGQYRPDYCIVGEPSGWNGLTLGYKGIVDLEVDLVKDWGHTAGQASSAPEEGVLFWEKVQHYCQGFSAEEGIFNNITPTLSSFQTGGDGLVQWAKLGIRLRLPPGCEEGVLEEGLKALNPEAKLTFSGFQPAFKAGKANPLVASFLGAIRKEGGRPSFKLKSGTADMNLAGPAWKCPILAYGPGDSRLDHTPRERISLLEYQQAIAVLARVLTSI